MYIIADKSNYNPIDDFSMFEFFALTSTILYKLSNNDIIIYESHYPVKFKLTGKIEDIRKSILSHLPHSKSHKFYAVYNGVTITIDNVYSMDGGSAQLSFYSKCNNVRTINIFFLNDKNYLVRRRYISKYYICETIDDIIQFVLDVWSDDKNV